MTSAPRPRLAILTVALVLLAACSGGSDGSDGDDAATTTTEPVVVADWTQVGVGSSALATNPVPSFSGGIESENDLPAVLYGSLSEPGRASRGVVWPWTEGGLGEPQTLDAGASSSTINHMASGGGVTLAAGGAWSDGQTTSFAFRSEDRRDWTEIDLPEELDERGAYVGRVAVLPDGGALGFGVDEDHVPVVVDLESGEMVDLPSPDRARPLSVDGVVALDSGPLVLLLSAEPSEGGLATFAYASDDGGGSWSGPSLLPGEGAVVAGVTGHAGALVATGQHQVGTDTVAAAWRSADGTEWTFEALPEDPYHHPGWATWLGGPTVTDSGDLYVARSDEGWLGGHVLRRDASGAWTEAAILPDWIAPGAGALLVADGDRLDVVRISELGRHQTGQVRPDGSWAATSDLPDASSPVDWVAMLGLDGEVPVLMGGRAVIEVGPDGRWSRLSDLTRFDIDGSSLEPGEWSPAQSEALARVRLVTDTTGRTVLLGEELRPQIDDADGSDLVGWVRDPGGDWQPVTGLAGPRSEFVDALVTLGDLWVAVGADRDSFTLSEHSRGAVWVSVDGLTWERQTGPFDVSPDLDSYLTGACRLPDGELLVVGAVENPGTAYAPLAFRQAEGGWERVDTADLGDGVTSLTSCAGVGDEVVVQGTAQTHGTWRTVDGRTFEPIEIGAENDFVGPITAFEHGYAAPGAVMEGPGSRPVVWLSADGSDWTAVDIPVDRPMSATHLLAWGDRIVVALTSVPGVAVSILENAADLLDQG